MFENSNQVLGESLHVENEGGGALFGIGSAADVGVLRGNSAVSDGVRVCEVGEGERGEGWRAENVETPFGVTDDTVSLRNGNTYYFFKLPHKVIVQLYIIYQSVCGCYSNLIANTYMHSSILQLLLWWALFHFSSKAILLRNFTKFVHVHVCFSLFIEVLQNFTKFVQIEF